MTLFLIDTHSFVDVITNSSSELFICDSKKSVIMIKELLQKVLDLYFESTDDSYPYSKSFDDIFGRIFIIDRENQRGIVETLRGFDAYHNQKLIGKVAVYSASDNTIPWAVQQWIEDVFNAKRIHMG